MCYSIQHDDMGNVYAVFSSEFEMEDYKKANPEYRDRQVFCFNGYYNAIYLGELHHDQQAQADD